MFYIVLFSLLTSSVAIDGVFGNRGIWTEFGDFDYFVSNETVEVTLSEARNACVQDSQYELAMVKNRNISNFLFSLINKTASSNSSFGPFAFWVGVTRMWTDGERISEDMLNNTSKNSHCKDCILLGSVDRLISPLLLNVVPCPNVTGYICQRSLSISNWGNWSSWSDCTSHSCNETQNRTRECKAYNVTRRPDMCDGNDTEVQSCSVCTTHMSTQTKAISTTPSTAQKVTGATTTSDISTDITPTSTSSSTWKFDGTSFMIGFITVLIFLIILVLMYYRLWRDFRRKREELEDLKHKKRYQLNNGRQTEAESLSFGLSSSAIVMETGNPSSPSYENIINKSGLTIDTTCATHVNESVPTLGFSQREPVSLLEDVQYIEPETLPGFKEKFDGYEEPLPMRGIISATNPGCSQNDPGYVNITTRNANVLAELQSPVPTSVQSAERKIALPHVKENPVGDIVPSTTSNTNNKNGKVVTTNRKVALKPASSSELLNTSAKIDFTKVARKDSMDVLKPIGNDSNTEKGVLEGAKAALKPVSKRNNTSVLSTKVRSLPSFLKKPTGFKLHVKTKKDNENETSSKKVALKPIHKNVAQSATSSQNQTQAKAEVHNFGDVKKGLKPVNFRRGL